MTSDKEEEGGSHFSDTFVWRSNLNNHFCATEGSGRSKNIIMCDVIYRWPNTNKFFIEVPTAFEPSTFWSRGKCFASSSLIYRSLLFFNKMFGSNFKLGLQNYPVYDLYISRPAQMSLYQSIVLAGI